MNLFVTNKNPYRCAQEHCDVHVVKMIVETAQLLSTAHVSVDGKQVAYKKTHEFHPCAIWVRESMGNYLWAFRLFCALLDEYTYRTGKFHKSEAYRKALAVPPRILAFERTPFVAVVPDSFAHLPTIEAYQAALNAKLSEWRERPRPLRTTFTRRAVPPFLSGVGVAC